jgi:hypothetical protein
MLPFDAYPGGGSKLLGRARGTVCRRGYGLDFMRKTSQTTCAYCAADFAASYTTWLTMALDHVVPASVCISMGVPEDWREDCSNKVLSCGACNGFRNRYKPMIDVVQPLTLEVFYELRDHIFAERKELIAASHMTDRAFFEERPWTGASRRFE